MDIEKIIEGTAMKLTLKGRLDTVTAPDLEEFISIGLDGITELTMDFEELEYISSAGLRVLLTAHNTMSEQGSMTVTNVNEEILEIFEITGFDDFLNIE